ncbi:MAG: hypothetical protein AAB519_03510, partial [Patescibacteria group bacterium]
HFTSRTEDVRLGQGLEYISNQLYAIRQEIVLDGITAVGSMGSEVGFTGGADLAEHYYSNETLTAGEVVAIDTSLSAGVKKTSSAYQKDALGIVATEPGLVLGTGADNSYPIALVGRVPVKVTNENGPIYAGDRLTSAARSGYAMRAIQSGRVIGEALGDAVDWVVCDGEDPNDFNAKLCTTVMVFVNLSDYTGQSVELAMAERDAAQGLSGSSVLDGVEQGLTSEDASIRLATAMPTKQEKILAFLKEIRDKQGAQSGSEVFTGRLAASEEIITPTLYADQIFAKSIKADSIEGLQIFTDQIGSLDAKYQALAQSVTVEGENKESSMKMLTIEQAKITLALNVMGQLAAEGGIVVGGDAQFDGDTVFNKLASFLGGVTFKDKVAFEQAPTFGKDTAGFAVIKEGQKAVTVSFDDDYTKQPIVSATLTNDRSALLDDDSADAATKADAQAVDQDLADAFFAEDVKYIVSNKSQKGFMIILNKPAPRDLQFSWVAIAVEKSKTFYSKEEATTEVLGTSDTEDEAIDTGADQPVSLPPEVPIDGGVDAPSTESI